MGIWRPRSCTPRHRTNTLHGVCPPRSCPPSAATCRRARGRPGRPPQSCDPDKGVDATSSHGSPMPSPYELRPDDTHGGGDVRRRRDGPRRWRTRWWRARWWRNAYLGYAALTKVLAALPQTLTLLSFQPFLRHSPLSGTALSQALSTPAGRAFPFRALRRLGRSRSAQNQSKRLKSGSISRQEFCAGAPEGGGLSGRS